MSGDQGIINALPIPLLRPTQPSLSPGRFENIIIKCGSKAVYLPVGVGTCYESIEIVVTVG